MNQILHVLLVEDSEDDAQLILHFLTEGGFQPVWRRVETLTQMAQALDDKAWDLILSDYNLPRFTGLEALGLVQERNLDIPFLLVSGAIGEETAVSAMRSGANDYLLKDNLARLVPAIKRELKEAQSRCLRREAEQEREELHQALAEAKELAELANQRKSKVLAFVAHEFKNPLNAIATFSNLLSRNPEGNLSKQEQSYVAHIGTACEHLRELINDILDIAPIEAGIIELNMRQVRLDSLLDDVRAIMATPAAKKGIELDFQIESGLDYLNVDAKRFRQILINLLSNAVKYTHEGDTVTLTIASNLMGPGVLIRVIDHGPGIPEDELKNLFQDYYRVRNKLTAQQEGLGLGLALTKKLVELHDGVICVNSQAGLGTSFEILLPESCIAAKERVFTLVRH